MASRTCIGCGTVADKGEFVRLVRTPDGGVRPDAGGREPGRGAYVHARAACIDRAIDTRQVDSRLRIKLDDASRRTLRSELEGLLAQAPGGAGRDAGGRHSECVQRGNTID